MEQMSALQLEFEVSGYKSNKWDWFLFDKSTNRNIEVRLNCKIQKFSYKLPKSRTHAKAFKNGALCRQHNHTYVEPIILFRHSALIEGGQIYYQAGLQ